MESGEYLTVVRDRSAALLAAARLDLNVSLPSCPDWTMASLVTHIGRVWGRAAAVVTAGANAEGPTVPEGLDGTDLIEWAEGRAHDIVAALEIADPASDCWSFGEPQTRLFWFRRQALETAVHAWDVERAVTDPQPIDPDLAGDGIDEFLDLWLPRFFQRHPGNWSGQTFHLHRTDGDGEWFLRLGPQDTVAVEHLHAKADVALRGPSSSLFLWILNRVASSELEIIGDRTVAQRWTAEVAF